MYQAGRRGGRPGRGQDRTRANDDLRCDDCGPSMTNTDQAVPVSKATDRGTSTRGALLAAAREVFTLVGYAQAGVSDIVIAGGREHRKPVPPFFRQG